MTRGHCLGYVPPPGQQGYMAITCPDGRVLHFGDASTEEAKTGDGTSCSSGGRRVAMRVFDWWFFVRVALEYDLGLARCGKPLRNRYH